MTIGQEPRREDLAETELARVDHLAHEAYGRDEATWMPWQWRGYIDAMATARAELGLEAAA